jgi:hypothetical protein
MSSQGNLRSVLPSEESVTQSGYESAQDRNGLPLNVGDHVKGEFGGQADIWQQECCSKKNHVRFEGEIKSIEPEDGQMEFYVTKCANKQGEKADPVFKIVGEIGQQVLATEQTLRVISDSILDLEDKKTKFSERETSFKTKKEAIEAELVPLRTKMEEHRIVLDGLNTDAQQTGEMTYPLIGMRINDVSYHKIEKIEPSVGTGASLVRSASAPTPDAAGGPAGAGLGGGRKRRRRTKNKRKSKKKKYTKRRR